MIEYVPLFGKTRDEIDSEDEDLLRTIREKYSGRASATVMPLQDRECRATKRKCKAARCKDTPWHKWVNKAEAFERRNIDVAGRYRAASEVLYLVNSSDGLGLWSESSPTLESDAELWAWVNGTLSRRLAI